MKNKTLALLAAALMLLSGCGEEASSSGVVIPEVTEGQTVTYGKVTNIAGNCRRGKGAVWPPAPVAFRNKRPVDRKICQRLQGRKRWKDPAELRWPKVCHPPPWKEELPVTLPEKP